MAGISACRFPVPSCPWKRGCGESRLWNVSGTAGQESPPYIQSGTLRPEGLQIGIDSNTVDWYPCPMNGMRTVEDLAREVNEWCDRHDVVPASGQSGERMTGRNIRYYRTLGLLDAPVAGGGAGYGEKHRLQLIAIRLLQAQGLPLSRVRELLFGRTLEELQRVERQGLAELQANRVAAFRPSSSEGWAMTPLDEEFLLVSRRGRGVSEEVRQRLLAVLHPETETRRRPQGAITKEQIR